jgi:hypothetical protein
MRKEVSSEASDDAVLQQRVPGGGEAVVAMEKQATVAAIGERTGEAEATKRASSRTAAAGPASSIAAGKCGAWVITSRTAKIFLAIVAIARAATSVLREAGVRQSNDFAPTSAGGR